MFTLYTGVGILGYIGFASTPVATEPGEPELKGNFLEMFGDELSTGGYGCVGTRSAFDG